MKKKILMLLMMLLPLIANAQWDKKDQSGAVNPAGHRIKPHNDNDSLFLNKFNPVSPINGWINVKDYGATGNGTTDDYKAIDSAIAVLNASVGGTLYFPPGIYKVSQGLTAITSPMTILGCGMETRLSNGVSQVNCTSQTAVLFTVNTYGARFENIALKNTCTNPLSSSIGILVTSSVTNYHAQKVDYTKVSVHGFYICIDVKVGAEWVADNLFIYSPVYCGLRINNTVNVDAGDWCISNSNFYSNDYEAQSAIRIEGSGGGKISNVKINAGYNFDEGEGPTQEFSNGLELISTQTTIILHVANTSIENFLNDGVHVEVNNGGSSNNSYRHLYFVGDGIGVPVTATGTAISMSSYALGKLENIVIDGCIFYGKTSGSAINLTNINKVFITGCINSSFPTLLTQTNCTNVKVDDFPSGTGVPTVINGAWGTTRDFSDTLKWNANTSQWTKIGSDIYYSPGKVSIGTSVIKTPLYVVSGGIGSTYTPVGDEVATFQRNISSGTNAAISIIADETGQSVIRLTNAGDVEAGKIAYDNATDSLKIFTNGIKHFWIDNLGNLGATGNVNIASGKTYQIGGTPLVSSQWVTSGSDISYTGGNVGIGYSTGTEITNNKLAVNGNGYFNGTITATGGNSTNWNTAYGWGNWSSNFGTASGKICQGNDSRLSDSRTASDVYAWAKASTKPSYNYSDLGSTPTNLAGYGITDANFGSQSDVELYVSETLGGLATYKLKIIYVTLGVGQTYGLLKTQ